MTELKFGWEAEFEDGAAYVAQTLFSRNEDLIAMPDLHRWHCECEDCTEWDHPFRGQTDSSCSGELISRPFETMEEARPYMKVLEQVACEVDAVPGLSSGFHVHVDMNWVTDSKLMHEALYEFFRWENVIVRIAAGRFPQIRASNSSLHRMLYTFDHNSQYVDSKSNSPSFKEEIYQMHYRNDRHSNLSLRTRHGTWEFRVWNSTRSAWRMELWAELSRAFVNEDFLRETAKVKMPGSDIMGSMEALVVCLDSAGLGDAARLLDRQHKFIETTNVTPVTHEFTVV